jgi:glycosyltransferase involved in cell wall biosynthesis
LSLPFISIVVPAYNRPSTLKALLETLEEQSYPSYRFEVLVCDDGSTPPLAEAFKAKSPSFSLRFLRASNAGPATARNRGIQEARGSLVAFTDDDCLPDAGWLEAIAEALEPQAAVAVHGPTRSSIPPIDPFIHSLSIDQTHGVATANFAVKKDKLLAVGGFDETFGAPYFEDEDLSRRLQAVFGKPLWSQAMGVEHPPRLVPFNSAWRKAAFYRFLPYMQRKHPGYWKGALRALILRVLLKSALLLGGCLAFISSSFVLAWIALFAWQIKRLQRVVKSAWSHHVRVPLNDQLAFVALEWLLDFWRLASYWQGLKLEAASEPIEELLA